VPGTALFVYGTLTSPRRLSALTGRSFPRRPARLEGWERVARPDGYPDIVPKPGSAVDGWLVEQIDAASLQHLDAYEDEGHLYWRRPIQVIADGVAVSCEVDITRPETMSRGGSGSGRGTSGAPGERRAGAGKAGAAKLDTPKRS